MEYMGQGVAAARGTVRLWECYVELKGTVVRLEREKAVLKQRLYYLGYGGLTNPSSNCEMYR